MKAKEYFDKKAKVYDKERNSGLIGSLVDKERDIVMKFLDPKKEDTILDAGCGSGYYSELLTKLGIDCYGVDISDNMIEELKKKGMKGEVANLESFDLKRTFDKVVCGGAMEFVKDPGRAIRETSKHLKKDGIFVLVYPRLSLGAIAYKCFHLTHGVNIHLFTKKKMAKLLRSAGLELVKNKHSDPITSVLLGKKRFK